MATSCGVQSFLLLLAFVISLFFLRLILGKNSRRRKNLPPGPFAWPIVGNIPQLKFSGHTYEVFVKKVHEKYGPIFTIWMGSTPRIIIAGRELAHKALIQNGAVFADRPVLSGTRKIFSSNQHSINMATYGPLWRSLRRNLVSETLSSSAITAFEVAREWSIERLLGNLRNQAAQNGGAVKVEENLYSAIFCILVYMCFGSKPDEATLKNLQDLMWEVTRSGSVGPKFLIPSIFERRRRVRAAEIRRRQRDTLLPLIHGRRGAAGGAYVDSLLALTLDNGRSLEDDDLVTLCAEFLNAGTDTTSTCLQWLMANLVIRQDVQARLYDEIVGVVGKEKPAQPADVQQMPYLGAVVKESLRRHPPGHFVMPHAVSEPCRLGGYDIPAEAWVNFFITAMASDPGAWPNPLEFRPERFADDGAEVDLTGTKEIKMIPFGAGRRICPGIDLALLHMHLIVARLVQEFEWQCKPGETVDLSEVQELTKVLKYPQPAIIKERVCHE